MALYAIISDIHSNKEALVAVLDFLKTKNIDTILCLGDIVGYNSDPNDCINLFKSNRIESIAGNHDHIAIGKIDFANCWYKVAFTLAKTRRILSKENKEYLNNLEEYKIYDNQFILIHGGVNDVEEYMADERSILKNLTILKEKFKNIKICFFAHTHDRKIYEINEGNIVSLEIHPVLTLDPNKMYFINPGSVDASRRDNTELAEILIFDSEQYKIYPFEIPYNFRETDSKSCEKGFRPNKLKSSIYYMYFKVNKYIY